jgi:transforming growth factor-beta-induced protein
MSLLAHRNFLVAAGLVSTLALVACGDDSGTGGSGGEPSTGGGENSGAGPTTGGGGDGGGGAPPAEQNIYELASSLEQYSSLVAAVDKAGLASALQDESASLTVFAPDNDAFAALLANIGASSLDDVTAGQLRPILLYHVLGSEVDSAGALAAAEGNEKVAGLGGSIEFDLEGTTIVLDGIADVVAPDVQATNGIIHGISSVILPSITDVVVSSDDFSTLELALGLADGDASQPNLVGTLDDNAGEFTVFAPPNAAFTALVTALAGNPSTGITGLADVESYQVIPILKYHVVGAAVPAADVPNGPVTTLGGTANATTTNGVQINGVTVTIANLYTRNGIIHVIDGVLLPSIADVVTTAPEFSELAEVVGAADAGTGIPKIGPALDAPAATGAYTLFAPNNAAITALGNGAPSNQALTDVLRYHVLNQPTAIYAADALGLAAPTPFNTLLGTTANQRITVSSTGSSVVLDDTGAPGTADVLVVNYFTSNGVIHIIDKVLIPFIPPAD